MIYVSVPFGSLKNTPQANFPELQPCLVFSVISVKAWLVERWLRKPNCFSKRTLLVDRSADSLAWIIFSNILLRLELNIDVLNKGDIS